MIVLDTNIISELMRPFPSTKVMNWIDQQDATRLVVTTITIAEIGYGLHALPKGKRRESLEESFARTMAEGFAHRILPFDEKAAHVYGHIMARRKSLGQPLSIADGQIASIARAYTADLATRNVKDFVHCELELIDPFK
jgi:predicted nucleic acid-binding protein